MRSFLTLVLIGLVTAGCSPSAHTNTAPAPAAGNPGLAGAVTQGAVTNGGSNGKPSSLSTSTVPTFNPTSTTLTPIPDTVAGPTPALAAERYVDLAKQDLSARLKIDADQITLVHATPITAADLYSGCTRKAGQVLMPNESAIGYQISLQARGHAYLYHAGIQDQVILCEDINPGASKP